MARKKRGSAMLKGAGAIAIIAFLLGMYTGIPGFSSGEGTDGTLGMSPTDQSTGPVEETDALTESGLVDDCVNVLIDGYDYLLLTSNDGSEAYRKTSIDQVLSLAQIAKGNDTGIRVKVLCKASARASAEVRLKEALTNSQLPEHSIFWPRGIAD